jgi:hypothetical protein
MLKSGTTCPLYLAAALHRSCLRKSYVGLLLIGQCILCALPTMLRSSTLTLYAA